MSYTVGKENSYKKHGLKMLCTDVTRLLALYITIHSGKDGRSSEELPGARSKFRGARGARTKNVHPGCTIISFRGAIFSNAIPGVHDPKHDPMIAKYTIYTQIYKAGQFRAIFIHLRHVNFKIFSNHGGQLKVNSSHFKVVNFKMFFNLGERFKRPF